jgi:hypothetical protein
MDVAQKLEISKQISRSHQWNRRWTMGSQRNSLVADTAAKPEAAVLAKMEKIRKGLSASLVFRSTAFQEAPGVATNLECGLWLRLPLLRPVCFMCSGKCYGVMLTAT